jgi:hypothetical protein
VGFVNDAAGAVADQMAASLPNRLIRWERPRVRLIAIGLALFFAAVGLGLLAFFTMSTGF